MAKTVVAVFASRNNAEEAVKALRASGYDREISLLTKQEQEGQNQGENVGLGGISTGVTTGGILGGLAGLAMGAGALVVPGIGPLIAAGPIAGLLSGAATGGIAGGLVDWGIPAEEGRQYQEDVKEGKTLVSVRTDEQRTAEAARILQNHMADNVKVH
ncbi:MAG: general stress protein [Clostridia bacterium]|nr:general stress protein [Clostridia bacterium]